jgi:hypothetical protein
VVLERQRFFLPVKMPLFQRAYGPAPPRLITDQLANGAPRRAHVVIDIGSQRSTTNYATTALLRHTAQR